MAAVILFCEATIAPALLELEKHVHTVADQADVDRLKTMHTTTLIEYAAIRKGWEQTIVSFVSKIIITLILCLCC
jgi:hypothetical protein